jgi:hypothetical protein
VHLYFYVPVRPKALSVFIVFDRFYDVQRIINAENAPRISTEIRENESAGVLNRSFKSKIIAV